MKFLNNNAKLGVIITLIISGIFSYADYQTIITPSSTNTLKWSSTIFGFAATKKIVIFFFAMNIVSFIGTLYTVYILKKEEKYYKGMFVFFSIIAGGIILNLGGIVFSFMGNSNIDKKDQKIKEA